ncbi:MAG: PAS domain-containing protein, partial [Candidatus Hodarchaeales archaeon]
MGLKVLLKRDDIPSDAKEIIVKESHEFERLQHELKKREEMYKSFIEDFKRTEKALRESEEKYRTLVERANDGIAITQDYKLSFVNNRFANMLGYTVKELESMPYNRTTHPDVTPEIDKRFQARLEGKNVPSIYETKLIRKNGTIIDVEFNSGVITYRGKPAAFTFIRDITERK